MKKYICLNRIDCSWAEEVPPREFSLPDIDDKVCPNCGSNNIKEKPLPPGLPWKKIAGIVGLLILVLGVIWFFIPPDPQLTIQASSNCRTRLITLTHSDGDGSPIIYSAEGLNVLKDSIFKIPSNKSTSSIITFHATQNGKTVDLPYKIECIGLPPGPGEGGGDGLVPPSPEPGGSDGQSTKKVRWTRVLNSDFCEPETCTLIYSETDNLGHTRERRIENYSKCCPANK